MKKFIYLLLLSALSVHVAYADTLTLVRTAPVPRERFQTDQLGNWDFRQLKDSMVLDAITLPLKDGNAGTQVFCDGNIYRYLLQNDSLFCVGYENATTIMNYSEPQLLAVFPLCAGAHYTSSFKGQGEYCHLLPLMVEGSADVSVEGCSSLLLPDFRVDSVVKLHASYDYVEQGAEESYYKMNRYIWISKNDSMPILEVCEINTPISQDTVRDLMTYYRIPKTQLAENKEEDAIADSQIGADCAFTDARFLPNPVVSDLYVSYHLTRSSNLSFTLCNRQGITIFQSSELHQPEGDWNITIPMAGLPNEDYVLHIRVDDVILSETIIKL